MMILIVLKEYAFSEISTLVRVCYAQGHSAKMSFSSGIFRLRGVPGSRSLDVCGSPNPPHPAHNTPLATAPSTPPHTQIAYALCVRTKTCNLADH
jgi:hypothetical protein